MSRTIPEIQQIPARHGTATFVPKGQVIKIINTYGRQVVDTWAFALPVPPSQADVDEQNEQEEHALHSGGQASGYSQVREDLNSSQTLEADGGPTASAHLQPQLNDHEDGTGTPIAAQKQYEEDKEIDESNGNPSRAKKVAGSETETDAEKSAKGENMAASWSSYLPTLPHVRGKTPRTGGQRSDETETSATVRNQPKTWSQYLTPSRGDRASKNDTKDDGGRTWASYFPSGKSFSSYVPKNVSMSAFTTSQLRDPTKSYAEQLYDFSKTPVGAGALSVTAATGSGYAGTAYAAYQAYLNQREAGSTNPPMEYLSMSHTHSATNRLIPKVGDTLVSNLRQPMLTILEDTAAVHDTVIAACDPQRYRELGVEEWEKHGSCAENLVLALKQINASAGLKGPNAVGADVTVNTAPQPLNLFMNIPFNGDGKLSFEAPKGKKGEFIRMRAERDVVVVMSACPQDVLPINGHKCMAAHFVVQEQEALQATGPKRPVAAKQASAGAMRSPMSPDADADTRKAGPKERPMRQRTEPKVEQELDPSKSRMPATKRPSQPSTTESGPNPAPMTQNQSTQPASLPRKAQPAPKAGKSKPKKLERRTTTQVGIAQT